MKIVETRACKQAAGLTYGMLGKKELPQRAQKKNIKQRSP